MPLSDPATARERLHSRRITYEGFQRADGLFAPVRLTMTSEDVIHSFFVPAFRTKQDVLPGRYTTTWFKPPRPASIISSAPSSAATTTPA